MGVDRWTARGRVEAALRGGVADRVPFTMYERKIPQCATERRLRNRGLCIVHRLAGYRIVSPNVEVTSEVWQENGRELTRTWYRTPVGNLSTLTEAAGFTSWSHEKLFKGPDDYKILRFLIKDQTCVPDYGPLAAKQAALGDDGIVRAGFGLEPLQTLISGHIMAMETFCLEWMDRQDEILKLYDLLVEQRRASYELVAASPATHANYGGNVVQEITGPRIFEQYYLPHYHEAAEIMHKHGKLIGCHYDSSCRHLAPLIARSGLDYIEAFTPAPDTDLTIAEARAAWPDQVLWLNFPSSVHLRPDAEVEAVAARLVEEAGRADGLLMGVTEDIPPDRWEHSCTAIMDGLDRHAAQRPDWYAR